MNDDLVRIGRILRRRRQAAGLTQRQLGSRSGIAVPQLSRIENGLVDARISTLLRILEATGGTLADVAVPPARVTSVHDVLERRAANRARLESAGIEGSDPRDRLDERERRGEDTSAERSVIS
jgi:transcriptional regulator with XRE-family HTH domain